MKILGGVLRKEALKVINDYNDRLKKDDEKYIDIAIELSSKAYYPFGAIIVRNGKIIGKICFKESKKGLLCLFFTKNVLPLPTLNATSC